MANTNTKQSHVLVYVGSATEALHLILDVDKRKMLNLQSIKTTGFNKKLKGLSIKDSTVVKKVRSIAAYYEGLVADQLKKWFTGVDYRYSNADQLEVFEFAEDIKRVWHMHQEPRKDETGKVVSEGFDKIKLYHHEDLQPEEIEVDDELEDDDTVEELDTDDEELVEAEADLDESEEDDEVEDDDSEEL